MRSLLVRSVLALAAAALPVAGTPDDTAQLRRALARCPAELTDGVLTDLRHHERCSLPSSVGKLIARVPVEEVQPPDWGALRAYEGRVSLEKFLCQLDRWVNPDRGLRARLEVSAARLHPDPVAAPYVALSFAPRTVTACSALLQSPIDQERPYRSDRRAAVAASVSAERPYGALRVAIDPGHFGGPLAAFDRIDAARVAAPRASSSAVAEGDLALRTALELERKLAASGFDVHLTRTTPLDPGVASLPLRPISGVEVGGGPHGGEDERLRTLRSHADDVLRALAEPLSRLDRGLVPLERRRLRTAVALQAARRKYLYETLRDRMKSAAEFQPDLMVSIHFNISALGDGERSDRALQALVHGNYRRPAMDQPQVRFRAVREALAIDDFNASVHLASLCLGYMSSTLRLPIMNGERDRARPLVARADGAATGIQAADLVVLRDATWPAVLTEGPFLTHPDERSLLEAALAAPLHSPGTRTERYAEALSRCIREFAARWLGQRFNDFDADLARPSVTSGTAGALARAAIRSESGQVRSLWPPARGGGP
jgi:N-acetylmuramoyl-L-alanine amidase